MNKPIVCNKCGKEFDLWDIQEDFSIERSLGYGTKYDGDMLKIHLCCNCMEKLIDECVITPNQSPQYHQMSFDELLFDEMDIRT